jgi:thiol-disulfide isomerase/thioredoxin
MKYIYIILFITLTSFLTYSQAPIQVNISGTIFNANVDSFSLSQYYGSYYKDFVKFPVDKKGDFKIATTLPVKDVYVLRINNNQHLNLILRNNSEIKIYGDAKNITSFSNIIGSDETANLNKFIVRLQDFNAKKDSANNYLQQHPEQQQQVNESFTPIYMDFENYKQTFFNENQNSPALLPLLSTIDPNQNFKGYEMLVDQIVKGFDGSPTVNQVKAMYLQIKAQQDELAFLSPGKEAPDFSQPKSDGKELKLSDLKGKVVLLDFWASWCGPCRRENPNVVKLYEKYKDKGFTVMSVSLDKDKAPWLGAIAKDNLSWPNHVSDLKGWSNSAAQQYKVTGIPFTVLIDKEGKIIQKNLRGEELEQTLHSIFGF